MLKMLYNRCTGIYKFGNNTYPPAHKTQVEFRSLFRGKKVCLMGREIRYLFVVSCHLSFIIRLPNLSACPWIFRCQNKNREDPSIFELVKLEPSYFVYILVMTFLTFWWSVKMRNIGLHSRVKNLVFTPTVMENVFCLCHSRLRVTFSCL